MISPLREDTLEFHHNQLRFMRYPIAFFLIANVTCVLHALTLKGSPKTAAVDVPNAVSAPDTPKNPQFESHVLVVEPQLPSVEAQAATKVAEESNPANSDAPVIADQEESPNPSLSAQARQQWVANLQKRRRDWQLNRAKAAASLSAEEARATDKDRKEQTSSPPAADPEIAAKPELGEEKEEERGVQSTEIVVINPSNSPAAISFLLDKTLTTLKPGEFRTLSAETEHTLQFHRGGDFGNASINLEVGEYAFSVGTQGWQLSREEE